MHCCVVVATIETDLLRSEANTAHTSFELVLDHVKDTPYLHYGHCTTSRVLSSLTYVMAIIMASNHDVFLRFPSALYIAYDVVWIDIHVLVGGLDPELNLFFA